MGWGWSGETRAGVTIHAVNVGPRVLSSQVKGEIVDGLGRQDAIRVSWQNLTSRARELWEWVSTPCMRKILLVWLAGSSDPLRVSHETQYYPGSLLPLYLPPHLFPVGHPYHTFVLSGLFCTSLPLLTQPSSARYDNLIQEVFIELFRHAGECCGY